MVNYCFVYWDLEKTTFAGFVVGQLESARQEEYVAVFANTTKDVFNSVGNFDIVLGALSCAVFKRYATPHAPCAMLYIVTMLIGCWLVLAI